MKRLSRVVLTRKGQEAVLQGMIHVAPDSLYEVIQRDVDWAAAANYQIFFEGVKKNPSKRALTSNESKIKRLFVLLFDLYPAFAAAPGISLQKEKVTYPKDAFNADITLAGLAKKLDINGFRCDFLLWFFTLLSKRKLKKKIKQEFIKRGGFKALINRSEKWSFGKFVGWLLLRKARSIILDYRNEVVMVKIREHSNGRNIFVLYGEKHIKGLVDSLKNDGWVVKETSYIDLARFC